MSLRSIKTGWLAAAVLSVAAAIAPSILPPAAGTANAKPSFAGTFFQETTDVLAYLPPTPGGCNPVNVCYLMFTRVPAGKTFLVTHVSCAGGSTGVLVEAALAALRPDGATIPLRHFFLTPRVIPGGFNLFTLNENTLHQFRPRDLPMVRLGTDGSGQILARCTIAGQVIDVP